MSQASARPEPPADVLERFALDPASIEPLAGGLIHLSLAARRRDGMRCVLQRVNPIFPDAIHDDIDAVTRHLKSKGLETPLLVPTSEGRHHLRIGRHAWRVLTRIEGAVHESIPDDRAAREAGRLLGCFHAALSDFDKPLSSMRLGVHDTPRHLEHLRQTLTLTFGHRAHAAVNDVAAKIFHLAAASAPPEALPDRIVHGDPKISNVVFNDERAVCMIDLDTIARMPVALELGDALRSWCNPGGEDAADSRFSMTRFEAALGGYAEGSAGFLSTDEWRAIPAATLTIAVELAARFAADALTETYFGWDPARYDSASEHNLARAAGQLALADSIAESLPEMRVFIETLAA